MVAAEDTPVGGPRTMFLIDAHNLLYRYYHAAPVQMHQGHNVNAVRGLRSLVTRLLSYGPGAVTLFDLLPTLKRQGLKDKLLEPVPVPIDAIAQGTIYAQAATH